MSTFPTLLAPKNIIVRFPNWLGDLVMATPILADLRHHWPEAKITAMCQGSLGSLLQEDPHLDEILNFKRPSGWIHRAVHGDIIQPLRQGHYDLGILLTHSISSAWWFWRGHVEQRVGYATQGRRWLLNFPVEFPVNRYSQHLVKTYKMLLEPLGIPLSNSAPKLYLTFQEQFNAKALLENYHISSQDIVIGINPGAAYGSAKCWLPERFHALSLKLLENPKIKILFFGDKAGLSLVQKTCLGLPERVVNLAGKTSMRELIALIQQCQVFITNDSGPMHIASALGISLIALFGSTSDVTTGPYQKGIVLHKHVPCSPCYRKECPIDFRCMTRIEVPEVYQEVKNIVNQLQK
jgi:heptosyltransferase II